MNSSSNSSNTIKTKSEKEGFVGNRTGFVGESGMVGEVVVGSRKERLTLTGRQKQQKVKTSRPLPLFYCRFSLFCKNGRKRGWGLYGEAGLRLRGLLVDLWCSAGLFGVEGF